MKCCRNKHLCDAVIVMCKGRNLSWDSLKQAVQEHASQKFLEHSFIVERQVSIFNMFFSQTYVFKTSGIPANEGQRHLAWIIFSGTRRQLDHFSLSKQGVVSTCAAAEAPQVALSLWSLSETLACPLALYRKVLFLCSCLDHFYWPPAPPFCPLAAQAPALKRVVIPSWLQLCLLSIDRRLKAGFTSSFLMGYLG